jgi:hypothetical protein
MVNKNFRAPGMSKNVIFLTFLPIAPLSDPFLGYFDLHNVGRLKGYLHMKFGRNRSVNKNFRDRGGDKKRDFSHFFPDCSLVRPFSRVL